MNELKEQTEHELIVLLNRVVRTYENWEFATKADDVYEIDEAVKDLMQLIETYATRKELEARNTTREIIKMADKYVFDTGEVFMNIDKLNNKFKQRYEHEKKCNPRIGRCQFAKDTETVNESVCRHKGFINGLLYCITQLSTQLNSKIRKD